jgi:hypothetical protein
MIQPTAPILSLLNSHPFCTSSLISDLNLVRKCELDFSDNYPSLNPSLKDELKSELSRLQFNLDGIKEFAERALAASRSAQTSVAESKESSEVISRIDNAIDESMNS